METDAVRTEQIPIGIQQETVSGMNPLCRQEFALQFYKLIVQCGVFHMHISFLDMVIEFMGWLHSEYIVIVSYVDTSDFKTEYYRK